MRFIYFTFVFQMDEVMTRKDFEVMAPVGSYESLYAALQGGADSVYFGVEGLNMRARSSSKFHAGGFEKYRIGLFGERGENLSDCQYRNL